MTRSFLTAFLALGLAAVSVAEPIYEWQGGLRFTDPPSGTAAPPAGLSIGAVREFDGTTYVGTRGKGASVTLSTVQVQDGKPVLAPFPSWAAASNFSVKAFDTDRRARLYAVVAKGESDELAMFDLKTNQLIHSIPLPALVSAIAVDDHGKSHTTIRDDFSSTVWLLADKSARVLMYSYQHRQDKIRQFQLPPAFDHEGAAEGQLGITVAGDGSTCYLSSRKQLWSFQTSDVKETGDFRIYPVCGRAATEDLQTLMFHPVARSVVFGRKGDHTAVYKVNPLDAWSKPFESQQVAITSPKEVLPEISSLSLDWKYDILVASSDGNTHRIQEIPAMQMFKAEQEAEREAMDFSDL